MIRLALLVLLAATLAACVPTGTGQGGSRNLGPSDPPSDAAPADVSQLRAGVTWLWQSVARLRETVQAIARKTPAVAAVLAAQMDALQADCADADAAAAGDDAASAREKWRKARVALGRVAAACLSAAATAGLSYLASGLEGGQ